MRTGVDPLPTPEVRPRRRGALVLAAIFAAGVLSIGGLARMARRERATLIDRFALEQLARLQQAALRIEESLDVIRQDLLFAGRLIQTAQSQAEREREIGALVFVVDQYRMATIYDSQGRLLLSVQDPRGIDLPPSVFIPAMADSAARALNRPDGWLETSGPLRLDPTGWFRVFAVALPKGADGRPAGTIALLVDMKPLLTKDLVLIGTAPDTRLLLLHRRGLPAPSSDGLLAERVGDLDAGRPVPPSYADLVHRMRRGEQGISYLTPSEGAALGLSWAGFIVAYQTTRIRGGGHWALATLTSAEVLAPRVEAVLVRRGLLAGGVLLCLSVAGAYAARVSRRAQALSERLHHAGQLAHLHEKSQKILDHIPTGVMSLSADGRVTALNRALRERLPSEAVGAALERAFPQAPEAAARLRGLVLSTLHEGRVRSLLGQPLALFGPEGQYNVHAVPLEPRYPEARVLLVIEDLSELGALSSQLLRAEKLATVGVLAAGIAHEIGTPLGIVRGRAEYIASKLGPEHAQAAGMQVIVGQIDHVARTLRQLLDFARVQAASVRPVSLGPLLTSVGDLFRIEAERRRIGIEQEVSQSLPLLAADRDQLQQVLVNLVMNACDSCHPGGLVRVRARRRPPPEGRVMIEVTDDGCGIPEEHRNQVFDPFFTTKKRGQGTGLGLTVAAQIVRNHGAEIEIDSEPGRGTRVVILWPEAPRSPKEEPHDGPV